VLDPAKPLRHLEPVDYWLHRLEEVVLTEAGSLRQVCSLQHLLAEALEVSEDSRATHWLDQAYTLLRSGNETPQNVARSMGMSYATFRKRFSAATGMSPGHYQGMKIIDKACTLIITEGLTNKEVAERLNYCDEFHFSRRFKQVMGFTPSQFRLQTPSPG
jgi:AraC-like DNA-binding protein